MCAWLFIAQRQSTFIVNRRTTPNYNNALRILFYCSKHIQKNISKLRRRQKAGLLLIKIGDGLILLQTSVAVFFAVLTLHFTLHYIALLIV